LVWWVPKGNKSEKGRPLLAFVRGTRDDNRQRVEFLGREFSLSRLLGGGAKPFEQKQSLLCLNHGSAGLVPLISRDRLASSKQPRQNWTEQGNIRIYVHSYSVAGRRASRHPRSHLGTFTRLITAHVRSTQLGDDPAALPYLVVAERRTPYIHGCTEYLEVGTGVHTWPSPRALGRYFPVQGKYIVVMPPSNS
jgi:hypothetical protein